MPQPTREVRCKNLTISRVWNIETEFDAGGHGGPPLQYVPKSDWALSNVL